MRRTSLQRAVIVATMSAGALVAPSAYASDLQHFNVHGTACHAANGGEVADVGFNQYGVYNTNTSSARTVVCPTQFDELGGSPSTGSASLTVLNRGGTGVALTATWYMTDAYGAIAVYDSDSTTTQSSWQTLSLDTSVTYYYFGYLSVSLPKQTGSGSSHLGAYVYYLFSA
jgi:hypothetical protein